MKKNLFNIGPAVLAFAVLVLTSCGSSNSSMPATSTGAGTPVVMKGTLLKDNGVVLNGVKFDVASASVIADNKPGSADVLGTGMTVKLKGTINADQKSGVAEKIKALAEVKGAIAAIGTDSFTVLGQTVAIDSMTVFANVAGFTALKAGDPVEVHGTRDATGAILATRVELVAADALVEEVRGTVANMTATTFDIGGLTITFGPATVIEPKGATFVDGDLVEVRLNGAEAVLIEREDLEDAEFNPAEGQEFEIKGFISSFIDPATKFLVGDQLISLAADATFQGGDKTDLGNDVLVEAEGHVSAGVLLADRIKFKDTIRIEANADKDGAGDVLGHAVAVSPTTRLDKLAGLADVKALDGLKIRGFLGKDGTTIMATRLERLDRPIDADKIVLRGPVSSSDATPGAEKLVIAGIPVTISSVRHGNMHRAEGELSISDLFAAIVPGRTIVKARGSFSSGSFTADKIELEDD